MSGTRSLVLLSLTSVILVSCASGGSGERSRYQPPGYAAIVGDGNFEVNCGMSRIHVMRSSIGNFHKEDGVEKTRAEFCSEYGSDTRIGR